LVEQLVEFSLPAANGPKWRILSQSIHCEWVFLTGAKWLTASAQPGAATLALNAVDSPAMGGNHNGNHPEAGSAFGIIEGQSAKVLARLLLQSPLVMPQGVKR
jgi:hypothetical protein